MENIFLGVMAAVVAGSLAIGALGYRARPQRRPRVGALVGTVLLFGGFPAVTWGLVQFVAPDYSVARAGQCALQGAIYPPHLMICMIALGIGAAGLLRRHAIAHRLLVAIAGVVAYGVPIAAQVKICQHGGDDFPPGLFTLPFTVLSAVALSLTYVAASLLDFKQRRVVG